LSNARKKLHVRGYSGRTRWNSSPANRKGSKKSSTAIGRRVDSSGDSGVNAEKAANARTL